MDREIKFRVWNGKSKEMIYPSESYNWTLSLDGEVFRNCGTSIKDKEKCVLQQFTGLVDKNENDIYEGDIVTVRCYEDWNDEVGYDVVYVVQWCRIHVGFRGFTKDMIEQGYAGSGMPNPITIIGNIFENPELIK